MMLRPMQPEENFRIQSLYELSFPPEERFDFEMLNDPSRSSRLLVIEQDKEAAGMMTVVDFEDTLYLFFFAIDPAFRNQGLGAKALASLLASAGKRTVFLLAEETGEQYADHELRKRRQQFYLRNGFMKQSWKTSEYGVRFEVFSTSEMESSKYLGLMKFWTKDPNPDWIVLGL